MAKAKKAAAPKEIVNPFDKGVTYLDFLKALPDGMQISEYLKEVCTDEQLAWLEKELEHFNKKK